MIFIREKTGLWDTDNVYGGLTHPSNIFNCSDAFMRGEQSTDEDEIPGVHASLDGLIRLEDTDWAFATFEWLPAEPSPMTVYDVELKNKAYGGFHKTGKTPFDKNDTPVRIDAALTDMTEAGQQTEALNAAVLESQRTIDIMSTVLNSTDAMIYVSNRETNELLIINEYMKKHFGIEGDLTGLACYQALHGIASSQCEWCPRPELDRNPGQAVTWEMRNPRTNRFYRCTDRYVQWPGGTTAHVQHCVDLTDIRQMQDELNDSQKKLHTLNSAASRLLNADIDTFEGILQQSMQSLAELLDIDRITIWKNFVSEGELHTSQIFDFAENAASVQEYKLTINVPYTKAFPRWFDILSSGTSINSLVRDVPHPEQSKLKPRGVKTILVLPTFVEDQF